MADLEILFEDQDLLAVNKPEGLLVEGLENRQQSLQDIVVQQKGSRTRALHRLDRGTTGIVLFAKNARWNRELAALFQEKRIRKEYWAIVSGNWPKPTNRIESNIGRLKAGQWANVDSGGKHSITTFRILKTFENHTHIQALPKTGRTHQIRLHCLHAGHPIIGDIQYSDSANPYLLLHARSLSFPHPKDGNSITIQSSPPDYWNDWISP